MRNYGLYILFIYLNGLLSCTNTAKEKVQAIPVDTVQAQKSLPNPEHPSFENCNQKFFDGLPRFSNPDTMRVSMRNGQVFRWKNFVKDELVTDSCLYGLKSLDQDTIPELVVFNYTGGAHCCNEVYVFQQSGNLFKEKAKLYAGFSCIDPATNYFTYCFDESFGYFFACYSCIFEDTAASYKAIHEIQLEYKQGRLQVVAVDTAMEKQLLLNLALLKEHGFEEMDGYMDSGWRKEYAMNLAVWFFTQGENWVLTKKLFDRYYDFPDAVQVWKEFNRTLKSVQKENGI